MGDGLKRARDATRAKRGLAPAQPKLAEIAARIAAHLLRFEASVEHNPWDDRRLTWPYAKPRARACGARVEVIYHYAVTGDKLTRATAAAYLAWLDAGGVGRHWEWERQRAGASKGESK